MAGLDDFSVTEASSLDDLNPMDAPAKVAPNMASNKNLAAHAALISGGEKPVEAVYQESLADLDSDPTQRSVDQILNFAKDRQLNQSREALVDFLADPEVSDEMKLKASEGLLDLNSYHYDSSNILSKEALIADSGTGGVEADNVRVSMADAIDEVNGVKREQQAILNREVAKTSASTAGAYADLFEYFLPFVEQKFVGGVLDEIRKGEGWAMDEALIELGTTKMEIKDMVANIPADQRIEFTQRLADIVTNNSNIVLTGENDYAKVDFLRTVLEGGYYNSAFEWVDNVVGALDLIGLGHVAGKAAKRVGTYMKGTKAGDAIVAARDMARRAIATRVQPTSVSQNVKDTNPQKARELHAAAMADETGEVAEAAYGASRIDVAVHDLAPTPASVSGAVPAKVSRIDELTNSVGSDARRLIDDSTSSGFTEMTEIEKQSARYRVINDFRQVNGFTLRDNMSQVVHGDGVSIKAVYGPSDSGFSSATRALESAKWALRNHGVDEKDITLLVRQGGEYVPTTAKEIDALDIIEQAYNSKGKPVVRVRPKTQDDYLIQVEHNYKFNPNDVAMWSEFDVTYNFMDRLGLGLGSRGKTSAQRYFIDSASMLDRTITGSASVATNKGSYLEKQLLALANEGYSSKAAKLPPERRALVDDYLRDANDKGLGPDFHSLTLQGFTQPEIDVIKGWREFWDTQFVMKNTDMSRTLKASGHKELIDDSTGTKMIVKELSKDKVKPGIRVMRTSEDNLTSLGAKDIRELYDNGGTIASLKTPTSIGDEIAEYVVVDNKAGSSYTRALTDSSDVLNYRKGYYTVEYTDPVFIDRVLTDKSGRQFTRAVATAGSVGDAKTKVKGLTANAGDGVSYVYRSARKDLQGVFNDDWEVAVTKGMTSQRFRGKRLEGSNTAVDDLTQAPILSPTESMIKASRSMAHRLPMRNVIETHKRRFIDSYGELLPVDNFGRPLWVTDVSDLMYRKKGSESQARLADARTTLEYINYLEHGYINALDDGIKRGLKSISNWAGEADYKKMEKLAYWAAESKGPTAMAKSTAFNLYLATNPIRQFIIQGHQAVQLAANFPQWFTSGKPVENIIAIVAQNMGYDVPARSLKKLGMTKEEAAEVYSQWQRSGLAAGIDRHNLLNGSLSSLADEAAGMNKTKRVTDVYNKPIAGLRKIGFDSGEYVNRLTSWLAHRDEAIRQGKDLSDPAVLDDIVAKADNYTYNMNQAGDMPYNQNAFGILFHFMQVPHKALLTMLTNRGLTKTQKARLIAFNLTMFTLPVPLMLNLFGEDLPEEGPARDLLLDGLESFMFNQTANFITGEQNNVSFGSLMPTDLYGMGDFIHGLFTLDAGEMIAATPSGSMIWGPNPRITNFAKTAAGYFNHMLTDEEDPLEAMDVATDFLKMYSGFSNAMKARVMMDDRRLISSLGNVTDSHTTTWEALGALAGMETLDAVQQRWVKKELYERSQDFKKDVEYWYKEMKRNVLRDGITPDELEYVTKASRKVWKHWGNDNGKAKQIIDGLLRNDVSKGDARLYLQVLKSSGVMSTDELKSMINALGGNMSEGQRKNLINSISTIQEIKGDF